MENNANEMKYVLTFKTAENEEEKKAGNQTETTTTIDFSGWTTADLMAYAAETVKIRQIQPKIRKGEAIPAVFIPNKPGTKSTGESTMRSALVRVVGAEKARALEAKYGLFDAFGRIKRLMDTLDLDDIN